MYVYIFFIIWFQGNLRNFSAILSKYLTVHTANRYIHNMNPFTLFIFVHPPPHLLFQVQNRPTCRQLLLVRPSAPCRSRRPPSWTHWKHGIRTRGRQTVNTIKIWHNISEFRIRNYFRRVKYKKNTCKAVLRIRIHPDPHKFGPLDPDPLFSCG